MALRSDSMPGLPARRRARSSAGAFYFSSPLQREWRNNNTINSNIALDVQSQCSNIEYLLTTTFTNNSDFKNKDIITGDFRKIDLYSAPFNIPKDKLIYKISDDGTSCSGREMHLFKRVQLKESLKDLII